MTNTQAPVTGNTPQGIKPEVGKRYVTRNGWVTPPLDENDREDYPFCVKTPDGKVSKSYTKNGMELNNFTGSSYDLISEYVEPTTPDTFRRDLIARLYVAMIGADSTIIGAKDGLKRHIAKESIWMAEILIKELEEQP